MASHVYKVEGAVSAIQMEAVKTGNGSPFRMHTSESSPTEVEADGLIEREDARMRQCWDKTKRKELGISNHYTSIAALIVHWAKELDKDLDCGKEVADLHALFRDEFCFNSKVVTLDIESKRPQHQFNSAISDFVRDNDGPARSNLLIVYYTGHGFTNISKPNELIIAGTANGSLGLDEDAFRPQANFNVAELILENATADTLLILDCCSASNIMKSAGEHSRSYELMAAAGKDQPTASGENSYTTALIKALKILRASDQQPFTTYELNQMITRQRDWNTSSQLYNRQPNIRARHITLAPPATPTASQPHQRGRRAAYLDIRIAIDDILTVDHIEKICKKLCKLPRSTGLNISDLEYRGFTHHKDSPQFKKLVRIFRKGYLLRQAMTRFQEKGSNKKRKLEHEQSTAETLSSKRKRTEEESSSNTDHETSSSTEAGSLKPGADPTPLTPASASSRGASPNT